MDKLGVFETVRVDTKEIRELYPDEAKKHSGRMKTQLVCDIIRHFLPDDVERSRAVVADILLGVGTSCVASVLTGCGFFVGCDKRKDYVQLSQLAYHNAYRRYTASEPFSHRNLCGSPGERAWMVTGRAEKLKVDSFLGDSYLDLLLLSPPFPGSHSQGESEKQESFKDHKNTYAGNDFDDMEEWETRERFIPTLRKVVSPWVPRLKGSLVVHIKDRVVKDQIIPVHSWVEESLGGISGLKVKGYFQVPLEYRTLFREIHRYPRRSIQRIDEVAGQWVAHLECGHTKVRERDPGDGWKSAHCLDCGVIEGKPEIREEFLVVAERI